VAYRLVDTHAHLDEIEDTDGALAKAKEAGLAAVIAVGIDVASNVKTLKLSRRYPGLVYPALGWHPENVRDSDIDVNLEFIESNIDKAVAVGEVGLDYHKRIRAVAGKELQKTALRELLKIAKKHDKPALIHSRYAWRDAFDVVYEAGLEIAVFHWYTGTSGVLRDIIIHGYYLSVTPAVEYHEEHRRAVKEAGDGLPGDLRAGAGKRVSGESGGRGEVFKGGGGVKGHKRGGDGGNDHGERGEAIRYNTISYQTIWYPPGVPLFSAAGTPDRQKCKISPRLMYLKSARKSIPR